MNPSEAPLGPLTRDDLQLVFHQALNERGYHRVQELLYLRQKHAFEDLEAKGHISVYLSHDTRHRYLVLEALVLLCAQGVPVYVDWKDQSLNKVKDPLTARRLKRKIIDNRKFILLATEDALSPALQWELGFADPYKYIRNMAILPILKAPGVWQSKGMTKLYPTICKAPRFGENGTNWQCAVNLGSGQHIDLATWLKE